MAGSTIDHLISVIVFLGALLVFISLFNQMIQTAILYQRHRYLATKCSDLLDNILLNPGIPADWGKNSTRTLCGFGLQDPEFTQYRLSPFSLMRLLSSSGEKVYYSRTGEWYSNVSWGIGGGYFLLQESECINYSLASKLLGINGTYGFQLAITPTVNVSIVEDKNVASYLRLNITVMGQGSPLAGASVDYLMFWMDSSEPVRNSTRTDSLGFAYLDFNGANGLPRIEVSQNKTAYMFIAKASLGGLHGIGYLSREIVTKAGNIIPFVENYGNGTVGTVLLAHKWGKNDPGPGDSQAALFFNATFYVLPDSFSPIKNVTVEGHVTYGERLDYYPLQIPTSQVGYLVVTYWTGREYGMVVMPWGIGTIGFSVVFGGDPSGQEWVVTDVRQVLVGDIAYQARLALWSLEGYGVVG